MASSAAAKRRVAMGSISCQPKNRSRDSGAARSGTPTAQSTAKWNANHLRSAEGASATYPSLSPARDLGAVSNSAPASDGISLRQFLRESRYPVDAGRAVQTLGANLYRSLGPLLRS